MIKIYIKSKANNLQDVFKDIYAETIKNKICSNDTDLIKLLNERENKSNTYIGNGIMLPHIKSDDVLKNAIIYTYLENNIVLENNIGEISLVVTFLVNKNLDYNEKNVLKNTVISLDEIENINRIKERYKMVDKIIKEELVILDLEANSKVEAIEKLANFLKDKGLVNNEKGLICSILERENLSSTGLGEGVAIPHGKSKDIKTTTVIFAKCKNKIDWESIDDEPVDMIFLFAINEEEKTDQYIDILSSISRRIADDEFLESIRKAKTAKEIIEIIKK